MKGNIDAALKAEFRETARRIIAQDRQAKKLGRSQNTIGEITSALARAYVMGQKGETVSNSNGTRCSANVIDWITIPPRSRDTLVSMSFGLSSRFGKPSGRLSEIKRICDLPKPRWALVDDGKINEQRTISDGGVAPLIRLGLLESVADKGSVYRLSELGKATCSEYWHRDDADDPTLPKINLR